MSLITLEAQAVERARAEELAREKAGPSGALSISRMLDLDRCPPHKVSLLCAAVHPRRSLTMYTEKRHRRRR